MNPLQEYVRSETRRQFLRRGGNVMGTAALASLMGNALGSRSASAADIHSLIPKHIAPHFAPKAKQVIYLHMVGGPSQLDLFDFKPKLADWYDKDLPDSIRKGQRLTTMTSGQARFPVAPTMYKFAQYGKCGMWMSELLPWTSTLVDEMCFIRSMHTDAINHEPAIMFMQSGNQLSGRPAMGAWASYGLGSMNSSLPTFVVLVAEPSNREQLQAISARLWSAGFLPGEHAGVSFRSNGDPILYITNPPGVSADVRRRGLDALRQLNEQNFQAVGDPETNTRIEQYELAFRMQSSVPELTELKSESEATLKMYGDDVLKPSSFAHAALLSRRMIERGVRFVQVYLNNWDNHSNVGGRLPSQCRDVDKPIHGLITDLKLRGLFDETLIIWGGEFGRTVYSQGGLSKTNYGRDHHGRCFTMWMAGGGAKGGTIYGETDDFSYNIVKDPVSVHDFHATALRLMGIDHEKFNVKMQGVNLGLTGVEPAKYIKELIA